MMSRVNYVVKTIEAVAWLLASCTDEQQALVILSRSKVMLDNVWTFEFKQITTAVGLLASGPLVKGFWDEVAMGVSSDNVYCFTALHDQEVNPPGDFGNVEITFQPGRTVTQYRIKLELNDGLRREDYAFIVEKARLE